MSTPVLMPQMGESIAEGTIVRWIKKVGDAVDRDEPLFEISTDKVDAEIPSPAAGVLAEIKVKEGETVAVNSVVATIGAQGQARRRRSGDRSRGCGDALSAGDRAAAAAGRLTVAAERAGPRPTRRLRRHGGRGGPVAAPAAGHGDGRPNGEGVLSKDEQRRAKSSPLVRKIAKEHRDRHPRPAGLRRGWAGDEARHPRFHRARGCRGAAPTTPGRTGEPGRRSHPGVQGR